MKLLFAADEYIAQWVEQRAKYCKFENYSAIGVLDEERLIAGIIYHSYLPDFGNIEMSIATESPRWASRRIIAALLRYPFMQLGCQRITACIPASNKKSLRLNLGLGFKIEGYVRRGYGDDDLIVTGLLREDAAIWFKEKNSGKISAESPRSTRSNSNS